MGLLAHFLRGPHPKTGLLLTRAGPVENPEHRLYSHPGLPLAEEGRRALRALAGLARRYPVARVYAADSLAEAEAARLLAEALGVPFTLLPELRERAWGAWEGLAFPEVREGYPQEVAAWLRDEAGFAPPGGESLKEAWERGRRAVAGLLAQHRGQTLLLVGNCTLNRAALSLALPLPPEEGLRVEQDYARLSVVAFYGEEGVVQALNLDPCP
ncbi:histidine phosphatase family protein [Thermus thermamylovorans]|uniref:Histidine phosphatase family protein n=1 Tax=Thermus thermamylovorans TaxID=2509362 RepID=A0A4Q9B5C3_9DEIN|nr:histidine phosphatase family protein [Thermus thermamylovorans]TBH21209.1 histidine phosphatase family protein [Thermus thermamylovorans]